MKTRYFTNGTLDDIAGTGVTLATFTEDDHGNLTTVQKDASGNPYFGYLAQEITEAEYLTWQDRIANPDLVTYFPGAFGRKGVVNSDIYAQNEAKLAAATAAAEAIRRATRSVKPVQALIALSRSGITEADIYTVIGNLPEQQQTEASLWYEKSLSWKRNHPYLIGIAAALGIGPSGLDDLFDDAETIK